jgi:hypothetical protein
MMSEDGGKRLDLLAWRQLRLWAQTQHPGAVNDVSSATGIRTAYPRPVSQLGADSGRSRGRDQTARFDPHHPFSIAGAR